MSAAGSDDLLRLGDRAPWPRAALAAPAADVAPALLGALLVRVEDDGTETIVRVVETEAYHQTDPASHSHRGRTARNAVMFGAPGHAYVYFSYGMHHCMNVSCEGVGVGAAVLFRAAVAVAGHAHIRRRRGGHHRDRDLLSGPGRLTQALGIDRSFDGLDLTDPAGRLRLETDGFDPTGRVVAGPRVGIRHAADVPWRFHLVDVPEVSRYVRHPKAPPSG